MTDRSVLVNATASAVAARLAIDAAAQRKAATVAAAQYLLDLAGGIERAEREAAWSALGASVRILLSEQVPISDVAELCGLSTECVRRLSGSRLGEPDILRDHGVSSVEDPRVGCHGGRRQVGGAGHCAARTVGRSVRH